MKIETVYNLYDGVWVIHLSRVAQVRIERIETQTTVNPYGVKYSKVVYNTQNDLIGNNDFDENKVFPTKQALLESL
jgi:hypothetical protein